MTQEQISVIEIIQCCGIRSLPSISNVALNTILGIVRTRLCLMTRVQVQLSKLSHCVIANLSMRDISKMEFSRQKNISSHHQLSNHVLHIGSKIIIFMKNNSRNTKNSPKQAKFCAHKNHLFNFDSFFVIFAHIYAYQIHIYLKTWSIQASNKQSCTPIP